MNKVIYSVSIILISSSAFGAGSKHKAHEHGAAKVDIAVESKDSVTAVIDLDSPAGQRHGVRHAASLRRHLWLRHPLPLRLQQRPLSAGDVTGTVPNLAGPSL